MRIPLHLNPGDESRAASLQRQGLWVAMMTANPAGFRQPSRKKGREVDGLTRRLETIRFLARHAA